MTTPAIIHIVQQELEEYRRSGRRVHLAHAMRALGEALAATETDQGRPHVGAAQKGR